jgi:catechol 2,3-dioxygenase-like lactoylglutathione lyase family enzyme
MTNFNNLKKQAKQYLRWHRDRYYPVAAQIREALPRLRHLDDRQILASRFKLSDAQELMARQRGFESWRALKEGTHSMTTPTISTTHPPMFSAIEAQLYVADIRASCDFFTSKLGFGMTFVYGDPPFYAQVRRDDARINLRMIREPVFVGDVRVREHLLSVSITVTTAAEIKQLFIDFQAAGVTFHQLLKKEPWGARTFVAIDLDGNLIQFAGPAE